MRRWAVFGILFLAGVAGAFLLGRSAAKPVGLTGRGATRPEPPEETAALRAEIERLEGLLAAARTDGGGARPDASRSGSGAHGESPPSDAEEAGGAAAVDSFPDFAAVSTAAEASRRMMAFTDAQLERGPQGYLALLAAIDDLRQNKDLQRLFYDDSVAVREVYPWLRFLMDREDQVLDMTEWLFRTMAEEPQSLGGLDDHSLEVFTEGLGAMLPGVISPERLATFRAYAQKILETPKENLPEAVSGNFGEIKRLLERYWSDPVDPAKAFELLKSGGLDLASPQAQAVIRTLTPEQLAQLDVSSILSPLVEQGRYEAIQLLQRLPEDSVNTAPLDSIVLAKLEKGEISGGFVRGYLDATKRLTWLKARDFIERALSGGDQARMQGIQMLVYLPEGERPDKQYVADLLRRYEVDENYARWIKSAYQIE